jgi:hypothetical protein
MGHPLVVRRYNPQEHELYQSGPYRIRELAESRRRNLSCRLCSSTNEAEFTAEMMIHFSGRKHLENPGVLAFPEMLVCLDCGSGRFRIAEGELNLLREGNAPPKGTDGHLKAS